MLVKTTIPEIIEAMLNPNVEIKNNSICGKCSECGECCTNFLPVSQNEVNKIQRYVIENKIRPQRQMLVMQNRLNYPYYNGKKCLIYEVRPLICREFYCNKKPNMEMARKFEKDEYIPVDMWSIAEEIDKYYSRISL